MSTAVRDIFRERMPRHAFATNDLLYGLRMVPGSDALRFALLQANAKHSVSWLLYDLDTPTAILDWQDRDCPPPNLLARNPTNGHAHLFYGLDSAVHAYASAKPKPQRFLASVDLALTQKLGADPGYAKLICKNPLHGRWDVHEFRRELYDLPELADWLDLQQYRGRRQLPAIGHGRNCALFEALRFWAYRARRRSWLSETYFREAVLGHGLQINAGFSPPLPHAEVRATAKSIACWTWRRGQFSALGFQLHQQRLSKKGIEAIRRRTEATRAAVLDAVARNPGMSKTELAAYLGMPRRTLYNYLCQTPNQINSPSGLPGGPDTVYQTPSQSGVVPSSQETQNTVPVYQGGER